MSNKTEPVAITVVGDQFIHGRTYPDGKTVTVPKDVAARLVSRGHARHAGRDESPHVVKPSESMQDFPGAAALAAAGINSPDEMRAFIAAHGDGFHARIEGVGKSTAAAIVAALQQ